MAAEEEKKEYMRGKETRTEEHAPGGGGHLAFSLCGDAAQAEVSNQHNNKNQYVIMCTWHTPLRLVCAPPRRVTPSRC